MTEEDWLKSRDPKPMLDFIRGRTSDRKLRLFAVACCQQIGHLIEYQPLRDAVGIAGQFAEGQISNETRKAVYDDVFWRTGQDWYDIPIAVLTSVAIGTEFEPGEVALAVANTLATLGDLRWG